MEFILDLVSSGNAPVNQTTPAIKIAAPENLANLRKSKLPPKNASTAKSQLAATGIAARWQG